MATSKTTSKATTVEQAPIESVPVRTTAQTMNGLARDVNAAQRRKHELAQQYKAMEQVKVTISPFYAPYFGNVMPIVINGISVHVPCDGKVHSIPKVYADEVQRRVKKVDAQITRQNIMSNFIEEDYAGAMDLDID